MRPRGTRASSRRAGSGPVLWQNAAMPAPGFAADLEGHRPYLLRVARLQLRDEFSRYHPNDIIDAYLAN